MNLHERARDRRRSQARLDAAEAAPPRQVEEPVAGRFSVLIRLEGSYKLDYPSLYPGGPRAYLEESVLLGVERLEDQLLFGRVERRRVRISHDRLPVPGAAS